MSWYKDLVMIRKEASPKSAKMLFLEDVTGIRAGREAYRSSKEEYPNSVGGNLGYGMLMGALHFLFPTGVNGMNLALSSDDKKGVEAVTKIGGGLLLASLGSVEKYVAVSMVNGGWELFAGITIAEHLVNSTFNTINQLRRRKK